MLEHSEQGKEIAWCTCEEELRGVVYELRVHAAIYRQLLGYSFVGVEEVFQEQSVLIRQSWRKILIIRFSSTIERHRMSA